MKHATKIEWTQRAGTKGETLNPIRARNLETGGIGHFCQHVSPGCERCYAERLQPRFRNPIKYRPQDRDKVEIFLDEKVLTKPLRWRAPRTIFWCSMTDIAAPWVEDAWLDKIFAVCACTAQHTHQILTKYPERLRDYFDALEFDQDDRYVRRPGADYGRDGDHVLLLERDQLWPLRNVWLGTSCEDQRRFDERWPHLRDTPAAVRFISYEPALEAIDIGDAVLEQPRDVVQTLSRYYEPGTDGAFDPSGSQPTRDLVNRSHGLHWVIAGGESAGVGQQDPRAINWDWFRLMRDQCRAARIAYFVKQGNKGPGWKDPIPEDLQIYQWPEVS